MSDKSDKAPSRLPGSSKSYDLQGDTADFDPGALQVHEFSPEMRQQISATKLPRFTPRSSPLEPAPVAKQRLNQRFLRVVSVNEAPRVSEPVPDAACELPELPEPVVDPREPAERSGVSGVSRDAPTVLSARVVARRAAARSLGAEANRAQTAAPVPRWLWALAALCLVVGGACFWLTRPPRLEPDAKVPVIEAAQAEKQVPRQPEPKVEPPTTQRVDEALPVLPSASVTVAKPRPPTRAQTEPRPTSRATPTRLKSHSADSTAPGTTEPASVFDTPLRPPAVRTRRN